VLFSLKTVLQRVHDSARAASAQVGIGGRSTGENEAALLNAPPGALKVEPGPAAPDAAPHPPPIQCPASYPPPEVAAQLAAGAEFAVRGAGVAGAHVGLGNTSDATLSVGAHSPSLDESSVASRRTRANSEVRF
jgi:hypothetical protein